MAPSTDTCVCGCGASLRRSPSDHFATEACQRRWQRNRVGAPPDAADYVRDAALSTRRAFEYRRGTNPPDPTQWVEAGHTDGATVFIARMQTARRWVYLPQQARWELRDEANRPLWRVSEEAAMHTYPGHIEGAIEQQLGGYIPPIPRHPMH